MVATSRHFSPRAILRQRCPECGRGRVFGGRFRMNPRCPACGYEFERGPGYFLGAMLVGYVIDFPALLAAILLGRWLLPGWPLPRVFLAGLAALLPVAPAAFRLSRVLFIHLDRYFDPEGPGG